MLLLKNKVILDSSALLAFYNDEPGWQKVEPYQGNSLISAVNAAEVISTLIRNGIESNKARTAVTEFVSEVVPYDIEQASGTGNLISIGKQYGLSLGDRACLSLGMQMQLPVLTGDIIWQEVDLNVEIILIR